jgi:hypothetical protein
MELGDDCPPEDIWLDDEALEAYFGQLKIKGSGGSGSIEAVEEVPLMDNFDPVIEMWKR